ncbi:MAG TPA: ABC transporter ATP-binding protein [Mariprofundaceae bacterium]|nr:ABC transporter ATP-binding protein [Mariprofundaceae bacterium]
MIRFQSVQKTYPKELGQPAHIALKELSFHLQEGQTLGLIGPNGAGKSTTIRLMLDFIRPDRGEIRILGDSPSKPATRRHIGYLPELATLPKHLKAPDVLRFAGRTSGMNDQQIEAASHHWLQRLNLLNAEHRPLRTYSKGMVQRLSFAMALLHDPKLLILDEPMSGLDPLGRADIVDLIRELRNEGRTIFFCSHLLDDVERLVDQILVIHRGSMLFNGPIGELCSPSAPLESKFLELVRESNESQTD